MGPPRDPSWRGGATSDHSRKPLTVTQRKRKRVTRLSGAEKQRRWRKRNRAAHKAQQRDYRRRKRRTQQESDARDAIARRCRDDQEVRDALAVGEDEATRKHNARQTEAFRLAKSAGLDMMAWLEQPEAENWADMKGELDSRGALEQRGRKGLEQLGYDPFSGNPIPQGKFKPEPVQEQRVLTLEEACTARRNAAYAERMRGTRRIAKSHPLQRYYPWLNPRASSRPTFPPSMAISRILRQEIRELLVRDEELFPSRITCHLLNEKSSLLCIREPSGL